MTCGSFQGILLCMNLNNLLYGMPWLLNADWLQKIQAIVEAAQEQGVKEALQLKDGEPLASSRATVRDGVAIIPVQGAIFPKGNLMVEVCGAASAQVIARDLMTALESPDVKAVILDIDSPGGHVTGINELSNLIYEARKGKKPVAAYVSGIASSAGYWIASAVKPGNLVIDATAELGSIGVVAVYQDDSGARAEAGIVEHKIISSQSPLKHADPATEAGRSQIQKTVDALAEVFVSAVARNRGASQDTVLRKFGSGGTFIGAEAVKRGLADRLGSLEQLIFELTRNTQ